MVGLALEGGGAKGSYQAGAYMALKKCHIHIDAVAGTSIGSLNGAFIASHEEDKMLALWRDATMHDLLGIDDEQAMSILKNGLTIENVKWTFKELYRAFKNHGLDMSNYRALVRNNIDEESVRKSDIKYGLTTIKMGGFKPMELTIDQIPKGKLHDYIVASSYLPVFKREKLVDDSYYLDGGFYNLCPTDMLENMGCDKIYTINIKGIGHRKRFKKQKAEIIEIKPYGNLGSIIIFDKTTSEENITRGYYDTLKVLGKIDGIRYYFDKKSNWYYKRLNHKIGDGTYKKLKTLLNAQNDKEMVLKAVEYIMEKEKVNDLKKYKINRIISDAKRIKSNDVIYKYVRNLSIW